MRNNIIYLYKEVFHNVLKYKSIGELIHKIGLLYANGSKWELHMSSVEAAPLPEYPKGAFLIDLSVMPGINEARREYTDYLASRFGTNRLQFNTIYLRLSLN